jgi:hypothetical protein
MKEQFVWIVTTTRNGKTSASAHACEDDAYQTYIAARSTGADDDALPAMISARVA